MLVSTAVSDFWARCPWRRSHHMLLQFRALCPGQVSDLLVTGGCLGTLPGAGRFNLLNSEAYP